MAVLMLPCEPVQAGITYLGKTTGSTDSLPLDGSPGALTITRPAGIGPGDALVASISARPSLMNVVVPPGWVQMTFTNQPDGGTGTRPYGMTLVTYYKIVGTSEPTTYTWTFANGYNEGGMVTGAILAFTGIDTSSGNPIDNGGNAWSEVISPNGLTHTTPSVTTASANTMLLSSISYLSAASFGAPTGIGGLSEIIDISAPATPDAVGITLQMAIVTRAATGATGGVSATTTGDADYGIGHLMALKPSAIDPALTMSRSAPLLPGGGASYNLNVVNRGTTTEPGPLTVVDTLPSGLSYSSYSGSGWTCSAAGQTVTCSRTGALAAGATAPTLVINVLVAPAAAGVFTNSATVSGTGGDGNTHNNTAVDTYVIPSAPYAYYNMDEVSWGAVTDGSGNARHGSALGSATPTGLPVPSPPGAALPGTTGTCGAGNVPAGTTAIGINTGIDPNSMGNRGTIAFWYSGNTAWNDGAARMLIDASQDLGASDRHFFLVKQGSGVLSFSAQDSAGATLTVHSVSYGYAANTWHHIAVSWDMVAGTLKLYVDGTLAASASGTTSGSLGNTATLYLGTQRMAGVTGTPAGYTSNTANGRVDELRLYSSALADLEVEAIADYTHTCGSGLHHIELRHASGNGLTCTSSSITIVACQDAACSTAYTGGVTGALGNTSGMVAWPAGSSFAIASGSSSTTVSVQVTQAGSAALTGTATAPTAGHATSCNFGAPSCSFTAADAGFVLSAPALRAEASYPLTITAVKKADNSASCTPAFASVSKSVTLKCGYDNPGTGTLPLRVAGTALNAGNNSAAACDASGQALSLAFDSSGMASTTLVYADAGRMTLSASYSGSGSDAGLSMNGSTNVTSAPHDFAVNAITAASIAAGSSFSATVTARNLAGHATPNFGRESPAEGATLGFVRTAPTGSGAVTGGFSGSLGAFSGGSATTSNLSYTEVGRGNVTAVLSSGNYLGSGYTLAGSSEGALVSCASENGSCVLPSGATATVYYLATGQGRAKVVSGLSGTVSCSNAYFGDPMPGFPKTCLYAATSGTNGGATAAAQFKPHHFDVSPVAACGTFSYAGQPFTTTVTARHALGGTTLNYDGTAATSPNFARATTLSDAPALGVGSLSGAALAATAFNAGVASGSLSYSFSSKQTSARTLVLRATDTDGVSSAGHAEAGMALRSGRLRMSNAFGKANGSLQVPVTAEYWSNGAWLLNADDSCSSLSAAQVAISNKRDAQGNASTASTSVTVSGIAAGRGTITLTAPTPAGSSLSLDLALNLGSTAADQSCLSSHPASTGGARPWLRSRNGSCAATEDRDPAARSSFGLYPAETRRKVHVRDIF